MEKKKAMSIQLSESDYQKLIELCEKFSMSKTGMIRWLIIEKTLKMESEK